VIDPKHLEAATLDEYRKTWRDHGVLRIAPLLPEQLARRAHRELRVLPYRVAEPDQTGIAFRYWHCALQPEPACEHTLCAIGRWLHGDAVQWIGQITGEELAPPPEAVVMATCYDKGCYLDAHDDLGRGRAIAYAVELTPEPWSEAEGGFLEEIDATTGHVIASHPPPWNTLVLYRVATDRPQRRIPILLDHLERRGLRGWYYPSPMDPTAKAGVRPAKLREVGSA
jgi:hypothetical protein